MRTVMMFIAACIKALIYMTGLYVWIGAIKIAWKDYKNPDKKKKLEAAV